ncbi:MAG: hypothetical protein COW30_02575 [Rhodospirillales bacterium CG15_BIG_FIL_POST_REV_8_21_14_020_66_15]|nr:MAG: hypothetical protein COW30_02575 [Rhodospirillales bacterium CG15_BIG_FIL_POST_REV_8_21_14_020_66_15]
MKLKLKPATPGLVVRDPVTAEALPENGKSVQLTSYWRRRMRDGDVIQDKPAKPIKTEKKDT